MKLRVNAASNVGVVRTNNQDMILVADNYIRDNVTSYNIDIADKPMLIGVADGMGGALGGEYASEYVLKQVSTCIAHLQGDLSADELKIIIEDIFLDIHQDLNAIGEKDSSKYGLGTTFVGVLFYENQIFGLNVGDSRLYRLRGKYLSQLSRDHSLRAMTGDDNIARNYIANCFGGGVEKFFVDFDNLTERIKIGDTLLLCSDGLYESLTDEMLEDLLVNLEVNILIEQANINGGNDNISCVLIELLNNSLNPLD